MDPARKETRGSAAGGRNCVFHCGVCSSGLGEMGQVALEPALPVLKKDANLKSHHGLPCWVPTGWGWLHDSTVCWM